MFEIHDDKTIEITRSDIASIKITAELLDTKEEHTFVKGDVIRILVYDKKDATNIKLRKDVTLTEDTLEPVIELTSEDTAIGEPKNTKEVEYHYNIKLNPDTAQQTLVGHDRNGPKKFLVYPEGCDA